MKRWICGAMIAVVGWLVFSGASHAQDPIVIGLSVPFTGQYADYGNGIKAGIELAMKQINDAGGIHGRPLQITTGDSEGSPDIAKRVARKFVSDPRVVAEIGDFTSSCSMAAQPIYDKAGMVQLSPTTSHQGFAPGSPYSFSIVGTFAGAPFMARTATEQLGKRRLAVATLQTDWGIAIKDAFVSEAKRLGGEIVADASYLEGTTDFGELVKTIQAAKPDVLFLASMPPDAAAINAQIQQAGWTGLIIMGSQSLQAPELITLGGNAVENMIVPTLFFLKAPRPELQKFVTDYQAAYQSAPGWFAAVAYDSLNLLAEAIKQGGTDRKAIQQALAAIKEYSGVSGKIAFSEYGDVAREYTLLQIKQGEFVLFEGK